MNEKSIFVFIDTSLGELDWISPFLTSEYARNFKITIFFRKNMLTQQLIEDHLVDVDNITLLNASDVFFENKLINTFWRLTKSSQKRLNKFPRIFDYINQVKLYLVKKIKTKMNLNNKYDFIFRDVGLGSSKELLTILQYNQKAKVIVFPHAIGIWKLDEPRIKNLQNNKFDLYLSNTSLSSRTLENNHFFVSGIPAMDKIIKNNNKYFNCTSSNILILTRDYYERSGCTRKAALEKFEEILFFCFQNNFNVFVKHHPRDKNIYEYMDIQKKFSNVKEYTHSLVNLDLELRACLSFYTTAGIFLTARYIPVFDIMPYENCNNKTLLEHYCGDNDIYTHDLIELGIQDKISNLNILINEELLNHYSNSQFKSMKKYFPFNANEEISKKLLEL